MFSLLQFAPGEGNDRWKPAESQNSHHRYRHSDTETEVREQGAKDCGHSPAVTGSFPREEEGRHTVQDIIPHPLHCRGDMQTVQE